MKKNAIALIAAMALILSWWVFESGSVSLRDKSIRFDGHDVDRDVQSPSQPLDVAVSASEGGSTATASSETRPLSSLADGIQQLKNRSLSDDPDPLADPSLYLDLAQYYGFCISAQELLGPVNPSGPRSPEWEALIQACPRDARSAWQSKAAFASDSARNPLELPPEFFKADSAEDFSARDEFLADRIRRSQQAVEAMNAVLLYLDHERFKQWAGWLLPPELFEDRAFQSSRIAIDVGWLYACRLGLDCGPYSGMTLSECWETPGCIPGGAARQVVQMRRSPLELRLVDSMVERLMAERAGVAR